MSQQRSPRLGGLVVASLIVSSTAGSETAVPTDGFFERAVLRASDAQAQDRFGDAVAISGDATLVGSTGDNTGAFGVFDDAGAAYVFIRDQGGAGNWGQAAKLVAPSRGASDFFGRSVAISGDLAMVGAPLEEVDSTENAGTVHVFGRNAGGADSWGHTGTLTASVPQPNAEFGDSVAISGDTAVVGAPLTDSLAFVDPGVAHVFAFVQGGGWIQVDVLGGSMSGGGAEFGDAVAVSGDTIVVGAPGEDTFAGAAYVFRRESTDWVEVARRAGTDANFGASVAISGDTAVVGEPSIGCAIDGDIGKAHVYERDEGGADNWGLVTTLTDESPCDDFGRSVAISGDTAVVGDIGSTVRVFRRDEGGADNWGEVGRLASSDIQPPDRFGASVAVSGDTVIVGAGREDGGPGDPLLDAGAALVFRESLFHLFIGDSRAPAPGRRVVAPR